MFLRLILTLFLYQARRYPCGAQSQNRQGRPIACAVAVERARFLELFAERVLTP